jgi:putative membrane protein
MRRTILSSVLFAGTCLLSAQIPALAQAPQTGGPATSQPTQPGSPTTTADPTGGMQTQSSAPAKNDDKKFVKEAAIGGLLEVELGKLAQEKGSSDAVKQFGQRMVTDHGKANEELKEAATKSGYTVPASLDSKHQSKIDKLSKLSGPDFDRAYVKDMVKDHQEDIRKFQAEADNGTDPQLKSFASKTLPVLQEHMQAIKDIHKNNADVSMNKK